MKTNETTKQETGTMAVSELFPPELIEFTKQLRSIQQWVDAYGEAKDDPTIEQDVFKVHDGIDNIVFSLSQIASVEFVENVFYKGIAGSK